MLCPVMLERRLLLFSTFSSFCFAMMGIGLGLWAGSLVIVFDGAYSFVSLVLTLVSLIAASVIHSPKTRMSPSKKAKIEPLVVAFKGSVIATVCILSFISALEALFSGGREVNAGLALMFGVINVIGCFTTYWVVRKFCQPGSSALLNAEAKQWLMDTVISGAVLAGFALATLMQYTDFPQYAVYADPLMVIIASGYFVIVPIKMIKESVLTLLTDTSKKVPGGEKPKSAFEDATTS